MDTEERTRWKNLRNMKKEWQKQNYNKKEKGKHVPHNSLAESAAKHLYEHQWGNVVTEQQTNGIKSDPIIWQELEFNNSEITMEELEEAIKKFKRSFS